MVNADLFCCAQVHDQFVTIFCTYGLKYIYAAQVDGIQLHEAQIDRNQLHRAYVDGNQLHGLQLDGG